MITFDINRLSPVLPPGALEALEEASNPKAAAAELPASRVMDRVALEALAPHMGVAADRATLAHIASIDPATAAGVLNSVDAPGALKSLEVHAAVHTASLGRIREVATGGEPEPLRFSKWVGGPAVEFPLTSEGRQALKGSTAESPITLDDPRARVNYTDLIASGKIEAPPHPGDDGFWCQFRPVVEMQKARRNGAPCADSMDLPALFAGYTMKQSAKAVHGDWPTLYPTQLAQQFLKQGALPDKDLIPQFGDDFVNTEVALASLIGWAVAHVSPSAFAAKWSEGRARPEEVAWAIHTGRLDAPADIKKAIAELNLTKPEDFTAYPEGSPRHPAWPAMHSAASSTSLYLAVFFDLTPKQIDESRRLDYAVATFRSHAGVHYPDDNISGLTIGQEVVARDLPAKLAELTGADPAKVAAKIEKVRTDWTKYEAKAER